MKEPKLTIATVDDAIQDQFHQKTYDLLLTYGKQSQGLWPDHCAMKKTRNASLLAAWVILATFLLARFWLTHPDVGPQVPLPLAEWLINFYGSKDGEDLDDLEILFALLVSFSGVVFLTAVIWVIKRRLPNKG